MSHPLFKSDAAKAAVRQWLSLPGTTTHSAMTDTTNPAARMDVTILHDGTLMIDGLPEGTYSDMFLVNCALLAAEIHDKYKTEDTP